MCLCLKKNRHLISKPQVIVTANTAPAPEKLIGLIIPASGLCEFSPGYSNQAHMFPLVYSWGLEINISESTGTEHILLMAISSASGPWMWKQRCKPPAGCDRPQNTLWSAISPKPPMPRKPLSRLKSSKRSGDVSF